MGVRGLWSNGGKGSAEQWEEKVCRHATLGVGEVWRQKRLGNGIHISHKGFRAGHTEFRVGHMGFRVLG